jgi:hypothetical protein
MQTFARDVPRATVTKPGGAPRYRGLVTELRPSRNGVAILVATPIIGTIAGVLRAAFTGASVLAALVGGLIATALFAGFAVLYVRRARIVIDQASIRTTSFTGTTKTVTAHRIARIVSARSVHRRLSGPMSWVAVLDARAEPLLYINGERWHQAAVEEALAPFADRLVVIEETVTVRELTDRYPLALPFQIRRPGLVFLTFIGVILAIIAVVVSLVENF